MTARRFVSGLALSAFVAPLLALPAAAPTSAGPLLPTRASQVVELRSSGTPCATGPGIAIDLQLRPDGSFVDNYAIPPKQLLVVRRVHLLASPGAAQSALLFLEVAGNFVRSTSGVADASGSFERAFEFEPGLVVADVSRFCVVHQGMGSTAAFATGFLTKDK